MKLNCHYGENDFLDIKLNEDSIVFNSYSEQDGNCIAIVLKEVELEKFKKIMSEVM